jgi:hypothetical protein
MNNIVGIATTKLLNEAFADEILVKPIEVE